MNDMLYSCLRLDIDIVLYYHLIIKSNWSSLSGKGKAIFVPQYSRVQCSTVQCCTGQYSTVQYRTVQHSDIKWSRAESVHNVSQYDEILLSWSDILDSTASQYLHVQNDTIESSTALLHGAVYNGALLNNEPPMFFTSAFALVPTRHSSILWHFILQNEISWSTHLHTSIPSHFF